MGKINGKQIEYFYKNIVDRAPDLIQCVDGSGKFAYVNPAWKEKLGYSDEEIRSLSLWDIIHPDFVSNCRDSLKRVTAGESSHIIEVILITKAQKLLYVEGSVSCILDDSGNTVSTGWVFRDVSRQKKAEKKLALRDQLLTRLSNQVPGAIYQFLMRPDGTSCFPFASEGMQDLFEVAPDEIRDDSKVIIDRIHPEDYDRVWASIRYSFENLTICERDYRIILPQKGVRWIRGSSRPEKLPNGNVLWYGYVADITEKIKMEQIIRDEKERFETTLLSVGDGVISTDNNENIIFMNPIAEKLTGWTREEAFGEPFAQVFNIVNESTGEPCENPAAKVLETGETVKLANHTMLISKDGSKIPIEDSAAPIKNSDGQTTGAVIVFRDCIEKKEKQMQIEYLSFHDHLTGLYNRRYIEDAIKRLDTQRNLPFTIMVLDVNGLKLANDAYGHEMGDRLLKTVAEVVKRSCRADDIIGRIGGDEFCILLPNTDEIQAEDIKQRIIEASSKTKLDSVVVSLAVGYSVKTGREQDIETIKISADNYMYKDKLKYGKTMRSQTIETVLRNINFKYGQEQIHTERVSQYCEAITRAMKLSEKEIHHIKIAGALHDIGKVMVPSELLNKPEQLTAEEFKVIKRHPETGYQILKSVDEYAALAETILYHHERWDGTGYPRGLKGEEIPLPSRIIAVADAYEAMTAKRPYQKSKTKEEAQAEILRCAGTQFDPEVVEVFVKMVL